MDLFGFLNIHSVAKNQKNEGAPIETLETFRKKVLQSRKTGGESLIAAQLEMVTLLLCNGFVFQVRGFGCVQNQVLSSFSKGA